MTSRPVRVRIAPSPTGDPHVGTAYIGLFNMVFARKNGGSFVLRIEDTDQVRSTRESEAAIFRSLRWAGLTWNEGPDVGGPYGPYRQSERSELYRQYAEQLIESGHAYRCFCTAERLQAIREEARKNKLPIRYDSHCRDLPADEIGQRMEAGEPYVVRMKAKRDGDTIVRDRLRGEVTYPNHQIDDQVLLKSDGFPTYHLANVVDDHLMEITHVIRAEEWIPSTPKHLMLYEAFGWEPPEFIHMPLLRNSDKSKISKRKNPVSLEYFERAGFLPEAMLNFLGMLGWSMPNDQEIFSVDEMIENFDWSRMSLGGPVFDTDKLEWLNGQYIHQMDPPSLARAVIERVAPTEMLEAIAPLVVERIRRLDQFLPMAEFFLSSDIDWEDGVLIPKGLDKVAARRGVKAMTERFDGVRQWNAEQIESTLRAFIAESEVWDNRKTFNLVRMIVTGRKASPPLFPSMEVLGKALCQDRFRKAMTRLK